MSEDSKSPKSNTEEEQQKLDGRKKRSIWKWVLLSLVMPFTAFFKLEELLGGKEEDDKYKEYQDEYNRPKDSDSENKKKP